ncbi:hypothetical protein BGW36DRAFT_293975 [Talaromyces proteolyticus]|uniref:Uncharacterized protein n=1 Tax=Talaromyces proteolyticus TaxID=1131652 RepID=A0AAD4KR75_9EURO|nr:uncharacterized protein BGW36DRAFT_293975 [Talaromyces proteolyticus]KAH8698630.1 hypothetical protein BGW36DRAFT_293975 [Talaromyces proteolyticus]
MTKRESYSVEIRAQIVSLVLIANMKPTEVATLLNIPQPTVSRIVQRARQRGFDPSDDARLDVRYLADSPRSGRPKVSTPDTEATSTQRPEMADTA